MTSWVLAAERAYVAAAVGPRPAVALPSALAVAPRPVPGVHPAADAPPGPPALSTSAAPSGFAASDPQARAIAAAGAVASRFLAVGTPRSFGIVIDDLAQARGAARCLVAHRTWFAPIDIRCAAVGSGADELADITGGRAVSVDEALACDIVNVYAARIRITPAQLRRGTHVNAPTADILDPELLALATVVHEAGLPALAAGLVDGRQLDELTIFVADGAPIALAALAAIDIARVP
ncbi:MAG TPA: hypothetical protein VGD37_06790 [Kofleriaceae bacterium]